MSTVTSPQQTSTIRVGQYIAVNGKPCRILDMSRSAGKHGAAKINLDTLDLTTGKKLIHSAPSKGTVDIPEVKRGNYIVIDLTDEGHLTYMTLMKQDGTLKQDVMLPDTEEGNQVRKYIKEGKSAEIILVSILDHIFIQSVRESST